LLNPTVNELQSWLVVGVSDDLDDTIYDWGVRRGYRGFKLKTHGGSPALDASWTAEVYRTARKFGITSPRLSADSNEGNATVESVEEYLTDLRRIDAEAYDALEYLEQPTSRHVELISQDWRPVTRMKPVFLDEGLTDAEDFIKAKKAGWSGFAIKTCKGHSFCLVAAAWARQNGLELVMQDLTNPGFAAVHSALFASHIDPRNGIELNSPQFTPQANAEWLPRLQLLLEPTDGVHRLPGIDPIGLGSRL
jgi:L-alanine-DL-glutamate epimerase-like enolase superfamily enzyme